MSLLETLLVAWDALKANKMRSILTMLGIIIGVGSVVAIFAIGRGAGAAVSGELQGLGSGQIMLQAGRPGPNSQSQRIESFTEKDLKDLETLIPEIQIAIYPMVTSGTVKYNRESVSGMIAGYPSKAGEAFGVKVDKGRWYSEAEDINGSRVVVLGSGAAKNLFGEGVNPVGELVTINGLSFDVIGMTEKPKGMLVSLAGADDTNYYVPQGYLKRLFPRMTMNQVALKARDGASSKQVLDDAIALLERNHPGATFSGESFDQIMGVITTVLNIVTGVLSAVAGISLVVGGVGIMNIMLVSVTERTREIGIRKAIGASYSDIMTQFLIEAVLLSLIGGALGVALAAIPVMVVGYFLKISLLLDWVSVTLALGFSAGVGILFGVYPASKAAKLDPIEALRYE
jgi:putative ABC transport system permease protein